MVRRIEKKGEDDEGRSRDAKLLTREEEERQGGGRDVDRLKDGQDRLPREKLEERPVRDVQDRSEMRREPMRTREERRGHEARQAKAMGAAPQYLEMSGAIGVLVQG